MRQSALAAFFCVVGLFSTGHALGADVVDRIVAIVNDDIISLLELNRAVQPYAERIGALGYPPDKGRELLFKVREDLLNQLVDQKLTDQEIARSKITVSEKEIDSAIERVKEAAYYTEEELKEALSVEGLTLEEYRKRMKDQILRARLVNLEVKSKVIITKEDVKAYYENHKERYGGEIKYHLRNIILKTPPRADADEKAKVLKKMAAILEKLEAGQPFDAVARMYSESSLAAEGGDLGVFKPDELSPQLRNALKGMKAGEFTPVLDTDHGYQIFFVQEIVQTQGKSLEEVTPEIEDQLFKEIVDKKFQSWLEALRRRSHIKIIK